VTAAADGPLTGPAGRAVDAAHRWFENHGGWAPPDEDTLTDWLADGVCRSPDGCLVEPRGWCTHGLASWWLILATVDEPRPPGRPPDPTPGPARRDGLGGAAAAHRAAEDDGRDGYVDPTTGLFVMTARYLRERGSCCQQGCRHCPFPG